MIQMNSIRVSIVFSALLISIGAATSDAQDSRADAPVGLGTGVLWHEGRLATFELTRVGYAERLHGGRMEEAQGRLHPDATQLLWEGGGGPPTLGALSSVRRRDGSWVVAGTFSKGAGRALRYWTSRVAPWASGARDAVSARKVFFAAVTPGAQPTLDIQDVPPKSLLEDIWDPQLLVLDDVVYVIASGWRSGDDDWDRGGRIWCAAIPLEGQEPSLDWRKMPSALVAKTVIQGSDPRVVTTGDGPLLAVRQTHEGRTAPSPVRFLRTKDLKAWTSDAALSAGIEAENGYAIAFHGGQVWMATTATDKASRSVKLRKFVASTGTWSDVWSEDVAPVDRVMERFPTLFLVSTAMGERPSVVYRETAIVTRIYR